MTPDVAQPVRVVAKFTFKRLFQKPKIPEHEGHEDHTKDTKA